MRLFIACELSDTIRKGLAEVIGRAGSFVHGVKWVAPGGIHITLKFLGEVEEVLIDKIKSVLETPLGEMKSFPASVEGLGYFPPKGTPRVVWAGVSKGAEELSSLSGIVESNLEPVGFEREKRNFVAHATLGRVRKGARPRGVRELVEENKTTQFGDQVVREISLIKSVLRPTGAEYTPIHRWELKAGRV